MNKKAKSNMTMIIVMLVSLVGGYYFFIMDNGIHNPFKTTTTTFSGLGKDCIPNWQCSAWSECSNGINSRICDDLNNCRSEGVSGIYGDAPYQPILEKYCGSQEPCASGQLYCRTRECSSNNCCLNEIITGNRCYNRDIWSFSKCSGTAYKMVQSCGGKGCSADKCLS